LATYAIIALYVILFFGFIAYEKIFEGKTEHFVRKSEADLDSDAVWGPGQGDRIREQDREESKNREPSSKSALSKVLAPDRLPRVV
jgi:hypothetical protein